MRAWVALIAVLLAAPSALAAREPGPCVLRTRWTHQPPYWFEQPGRPPTGYLAETLREAARRIGCEVDFARMNWARGLSELKVGRIDLVAGSVHSAERERFARFTRPINTTRSVLLLRPPVAEAVRLATLADLADTDLRIGIQPGAIYGADYRRLLDDPRFAARLRPIRELATGWRMLADHRLDGLLIDEVSALGRRDGPHAGIALSRALVVSSEPSRIMVGRHVDAATAAALDDALGAMVADGWLPRRREAWIPCATDPATMGCRDGEPVEGATAADAPPAAGPGGGPR